MRGADFECMGRLTHSALRTLENRRCYFGDRCTLFTESEIGCQRANPAPCAGATAALKSQGMSNGADACADTAVHFGKERRIGSIVDGPVRAVGPHIGLHPRQSGDNPDRLHFLAAIAELADAIDPRDLGDVRKAHPRGADFSHFDATPLDQAVARFDRQMLRGNSRLVDPKRSVQPVPCEDRRSALVAGTREDRALDFEKCSQFLLSLLKPANGGVHGIMCYNRREAPMVCESRRILILIMRDRKGTEQGMDPIQLSLSHGCRPLFGGRTP